MSSYDMTKGATMHHPWAGYNMSKGAKMSDLTGYDMTKGAKMSDLVSYDMTKGAQAATTWAGYNMGKGAKMSGDESYDMNKGAMMSDYMNQLMGEHMTKEESASGLQLRSRTAVEAAAAAAMADKQDISNSTKQQEIAKALGKLKELLEN